MLEAEEETDAAMIEVVVDLIKYDEGSFYFKKTTRDYYEQCEV